MRILILLLAISAVALTLKLDRSHSKAVAAAAAVDQEHLLQIMEHLQFYNNNPSSNNNYYPPSNGGYSTANSANLQATRDKYLAKLPPGPTVDYKKASDMADFFATPMGAAILSYFNSRTVQSDGSKGLNYYKLSDRNYRFWLSIKIIADADTNLYARSMTIDKSLFAEFIQKTGQ